MTLQQVLQQIHVLAEGNIDYPGTSEDLYLTRLKRVEMAIRNWEKEEGVFWNELFTSLANASDGDKTIVSGTSEYSTPSDFVFPVGYLRLVDSSGNSNYYKLIKPGDVQVFDKSSAKVWYVTGNKSSGFTIHVLPSPGSDDNGKTISYEYYKDATIPTSTSDVIEMSDPMYIVYWAASEELKEENPGVSDYYMQVAINKLNAMKTANDTPVWWQEIGVKDVYSGFGS